MTSYEKYHLMDIIWAKVINYSVRTYSLPRVCKEVAEMLKSMGYDVEIVSNNRDSRFIKVDDQKYRIVRNAGWGKYDVLITD